MLYIFFLVHQISYSTCFQLLQESSYACQSVGHLKTDHKWMQDEIERLQAKQADGEQLEEKDEKNLTGRFCKIVCLFVRLNIKSVLFLTFSKIFGNFMINFQSEN